MRDDEVLAVMEASTGRRILGVGCMVVLGLLLIYAGFSQSFEAVLWQAVLIVLGGLAIWMADAMRRATAERIELTQAGLQSSGGEMIVALDGIEAMDRGVFAFKPSNGVVLTAKEKAPARWRPGLWWRIGRRIGLGGVTSGHQSKLMAERIAELMAARG